MEVKYEIQVGGQMFRVSSEKGEEHLRMLAGMVEHRMQEIAAAVRTVDSVSLH